MTENKIYNVDVEKIKKDAKEISESTDTKDSLIRKYEQFYQLYPILFDNIYHKKMSYEEVSVLLDTFNIAQKHYINSQK
jgi:hypothetical protein